LRQPTATTIWIVGHEVAQIQLDAEHTLLFNPVGRGGAVVINNPALRILDSLREATLLQDLRASLPELGSQVDEVVRRLHQLEIIHPAGQVQVPDFHSNNVLTAWLHVTNACNLRCHYCYLHKTA